jgi:cell division protein FtsI/penicillin-binding protein 2
MSLVERRIGLLFAIFLAVLGLAFVRALWFGTVSRDRLAQAAVSQQAAEEVVPARRGTITDRNGVQLAISDPAADVSATPYLVKDAPRTARRLARLLGRPEDELLRKVTRRDTGFVYLARAVPATKAERIRKLRLAGIALAPAEQRKYPRGMLASQVLGTVGVEGHGLSGLEYSQDKRLTGTDGTRRTIKDALGSPIDVEEVVPAEHGAELELTLDAAIQERTERVLSAVGRTYSPRGATAVVMDPRSSEVLAMANWPRVDANRLDKAPEWATRNLATGATFEPGSTFKAFTVAGALMDRTVTPDQQFGLQPQIQVADRTIGESHPRGFETLTTSDILAQSSNVGAVTIGLKMKDRRFDHWVRRFGFGRRTGADLPGEERGLVLPVEKYSGSTMGNLPIGQGISVTPLQIATAYSAIANGGVLRPPRIVRRVGERPVVRAKGRRVISERVSRELRTMLEGVLAPGGTAAEVQIEGYTLAGKTGTANKFDVKLGRYSEEDYVSSFVGFAPAKRPKLLIAVMVDEPKGAIYGGEVAAPAFGDIAQFALPYLRIPPK